MEEPRKSTQKSDDELDDAAMEKIEQIEEQLEDMAVKFDRSVAELDQFKKQFLSKATEKTVSFFLDVNRFNIFFFQIATYLRKIGDGLQKECGEKPYKDKLTDPVMF